MSDISIIIPIFNKKRYLDNLFDCLKNQSFNDYECLIIDDGSTDGSSSVIDNYAEKDNRIRVFHISNGGVSHARNVGLDNANGKYVTFIDADDAFHDDYILNLYNCIQKSNADMVIGSAKKVWANSDKEEIISSGYKGLKNFEDILPEFAAEQSNSGIYGFSVAKILKREIVGSVRFNENLKLAEDLDFYLSIYPKINTIYFDDKPYYYYLQQAENSSMLLKDWEYDYFSQLRIHIKIYDFLKDKGCLDGTNLLICENALFNYMYFTIFYCRLSEFQSVCQKIEDLNITLSTNHFKKASFRQKYLMGKFFRKKYNSIKNFLKIYRKISGKHY